MTLIDAGLWCEVDAAVLPGRAALFLDRDGVIVTDTHYLCRVEDMHVIAGAAAAIARCNALGVPVVVVTNQAGIGRGYYGWAEFQAVQGALIGELKAAGAHFDGVLACAYHGDGRAPLDVAGHPWRKPNPGMILEAASRMKLDLARSWIVGDRAHDLAAGLAAGLAGGALLAADDTERAAAARLAGARFVVETAPNLADAIAALIGRGGFRDQGLGDPGLGDQGA
jgi:D-glycero-D-manno-heptose 1,7-bisphosphate phosphatase